MTRFFKLKRDNPINIPRDHADIYQPSCKGWFSSLVVSMILTLAIFGGIKILSEDPSLIAPLESHQLRQSYMARPS